MPLGSPESLLTRCDDGESYSCFTPLTACKISVSLLFLNFFIVSEDTIKNHFFFIQLKNERLAKILQAARCHILC